MWQVRGARRRSSVGVFPQRVLAPSAAAAPLDAFQCAANLSWDIRIAHVCQPTNALAATANASAAECWHWGYRLCSVTPPGRAANRDAAWTDAGRREHGVLGMVHDLAAHDQEVDKGADTSEVDRDARTLSTSPSALTAPGKLCV